MKTIMTTTFVVLAYASTLFLRSEGPVHITVFGMEGPTYPRLGVLAVFLYACMVFCFGTGILIKAYRDRWIRSIQILGTPYDVTDSNVGTVIRGLLATGLSLLIGLIAILVPTPQLRLSRIEIGGYFLIALVGSLGSAMWASRKLGRAAQGGGAKPT
ncbi:MAG: hypothetical protein EOP84_23655 [Verrucomicrobiaceae bacterium]|nr:MAG: hypothetical protein EOP84_23655 [Verrucomicrobiaceae bacterium]